MKQQTYTGEKETPRRPGSMVAYTLPTVEGGKRIPRQRPRLMSYRGEKK